MKIEIEGTINFARSRTVNGEGTSKQLIINVKFPMDDPDIYDPKDKWCNEEIFIPVSIDFPIKDDFRNLKGKKIRIEIN